MENIQTLDNWLIKFGKYILGDDPGNEDERTRGIQTSPVVAIDGDIITTRSGTNYKLGTHHPYMELPMFLQGKETPLEAVAMVAGINKEKYSES